MTNLSEAVFAENDPFTLFARWFAEAQASEVNDPNAMSLATASKQGMPDVRIVLMKGFDRQGFVFYTNTLSAKGRQLGNNPQAALAFHWKSLRRQVRVRGSITPVSAAEADEYYHSRPRGSQIGAIASLQSEPLEMRAILEERVKSLTAQYEGQEIPRPPHWSGYRLTPLEIEFWHDQPSRLHDRCLFTRKSATESFSNKRLYP